MCEVSYNTGIEKKKNFQEGLREEKPVNSLYRVGGERVKESYKETDDQLGFT